MFNLRVSLISCSNCHFSLCVGGIDFEMGPFDVTFTAGEQNVTVTIPTYSDSLLELNENFTVTITSTSVENVKIGEDDAAIVFIKDNRDCKCIFLYQCGNGIKYNT